MYLSSLVLRSSDFILRHSCSGSADRTVKFWDLETFEMIGSTRPEVPELRFCFLICPVLLWRYFFQESLSQPSSCHVASLLCHRLLEFVQSLFIQMDELFSVDWMMA